MLAPMAMLRFVGKVVLSLLGAVWVAALFAGVPSPRGTGVAFGVVILLTGVPMRADAKAWREKKAARAAVDPITGLPRPPG